jgi:serine/threonine protein kinase
VLIDSKGYIRIADFSVSRVLCDGVAHTVCGTPEYRAPELWRGLQYSTPVDWWAVGVMAYKMLVGTVSNLKLSLFYVLRWQILVHCDNFHFPWCITVLSHWFSLPVAI